MRWLERSQPNPRRVWKEVGPDHHLSEQKTLSFAYHPQNVKKARKDRERGGEEEKEIAPPIASHLVGNPNCAAVYLDRSILLRGDKPSYQR